MIDPQKALIDGATDIQGLLGPLGFQFHVRNLGTGSGGRFAWGEFVHDDRRLELHFRGSLGLVRYHIDGQNASHQPYMRELGVSEQCRYPGFDEDPATAFRDLAHDLAFASDFLSGTGDLLRRAAVKEAAAVRSGAESDMARYVGDVRKLEQMRVQFRQQRYLEVLSLAEKLKYPNRMTAPQQAMVAIARTKVKL